MNEPLSAFLDLRLELEPRTCCCRSRPDTKRMHHGEKNRAPTGRLAAGCMRGASAHTAGVNSGRKMKAGGGSEGRRTSKDQDQGLGAGSLAPGTGTMHSTPLGRLSAFKAQVERRSARPRPVSALVCVADGKQAARWCCGAWPCAWYFAPGFVLLACILDCWRAISAALDSRLGQAAGAAGAAGCILGVREELADEIADVQHARPPRKR
jgi:hypothetical protein